MKNLKNLQFLAICCAVFGALCSLLFASQSQPRALALFDVTIVRDTFSGVDGTPLGQHVSDTGHSYIRPTWSPAGSILLWHGWALHGSEGFRSTYLANVQLPASQFAQLSVTIRGDGVRPELKLRSDPVNETVLQAGYEPLSGQWFLEANEGYAGPTPQIYTLGTWPETLGVGATRLARVEAVGDSVRLFIDGVLRIDGVLPEEAEYNLSGPGFAGFSLAGASSTSGTFIDNFEAGTIAAAPTPTPTPTPSPTPSPSPVPGCTTWHLTTDTPTRKVWECF